MSHDGKEVERRGWMDEMVWEGGRRGEREVGRTRESESERGRIAVFDGSERKERATREIGSLLPSVHFVAQARLVGQALDLGPFLSKRDGGTQAEVAMV